MIWSAVEYFHPGEPWGDSSKVNGMLILVLDAIREFYDSDHSRFSFVIHNAWATTGHSKNSQHYVGNAVDFHIIDKQKIFTFYDMVFEMLRVLEGLQINSRVGLGIYPQWNTPGFHLDVRGEYARWGWLGGKMVSFTDALEFARTKMDPRTV